MSVFASVTSSLLQTGSGFVFQTLFADLLVLGIIAYLVTVVITPRIKTVRSLRKIAKEIGGPEQHWFYGHALKYGYTHQGLINAVERCKDFPAMCTQYMGFLPHIQMYHPDLAKTLLTRSYPKGEFYERFMKSVLNDGLVTSSGALWKRHRRLLTPVFHFEILKEHTMIFSRNCQEFLEACGDISQTGRACDITTSLSNMTFNNMMECVMSKKAQHQSGQNTPYIQGVKTLSAGLMHRFSNPHLWIDFIYKMSESGRRFKEAKKTVHDEAAKIIRERQKLLQATSGQDVQSEDSVFINEADGKSFTFRKRKGKSIDFLDILLQSKDEDGVGLLNDEINDEVITFFSAGQETVATAITWILYFLAIHQDCQNRCREEIQSVLDDKVHCDQSDLSKFNYVTQCIKESMRLCPPVHVVARSLPEDVTFSHPLNGLKKVTIKKGTNVAINIFVLHQNPHLWKNPETFDPERFNSENASTIPPFAYLPFAAGPRNCIGQHFGMTQIKVFLAQVLRRYEFHYDNNIPAPKMKVGITIQPENGLFLIVKPVKPCQQMA